MKKLFVLLVSVLLVFSLVGCSSNSPVGEYRNNDVDSNLTITKDAFIVDGESNQYTYDDENLYIDADGQQVIFSWSKDNNGNLILSYQGQTLIFEKQ